MADLPESTIKAKDRRKVKRIQRRISEKAEIESLEKRLKAEIPPLGGGRWLPPQSVGGKKEEKGIQVGRQVKSSDLTEEKLKKEGEDEESSYRFEELPLSSKTLKGLKDHGFEVMTPVQALSIPHALVERDIFAEAPTGSGKTLSFLVPVLENLYRKNWINLFGLGALIISPTRELASQIFDVLTKVGSNHEFSAGCVIGGKSIDEEQARVHSLNILIATPGRLLQHMDETPAWDAGNLEMLVIDEADRLVDMGFVNTMKWIVSQLPTERQTMLYSATLKSAVQGLALFSLKENAQSIIVGEKNAENSLSVRLNQFYLIIPHEMKLNSLFFFLRKNSQAKIVVFVASCKQVRFVYTAFKQLKPGCAVMELHGRMNQQKRLDTFEAFCRKQRSIALICTDVASRGIDFPAVDWVVQMDCPDSVETYIHRVGRTARYQSKGNALLLLAPSEEKMIKCLADRKWVLKHMNRKIVPDISGKLASLLASQPDMKYLAQRAIYSYLRSIMLMSNREVFNTQSIPLEHLATSFGLLNAPSLPFLNEATDLSSNLAHSTDSETAINAAGNLPFSVIADNPMKLQKNKSKLDRLKERIRQRKLEKMEVSLEGKQQEDDSLPLASSSSEKQLPSRPITNKLSKSAAVRTLSERPKGIEESDTPQKIDTFSSHIHKEGIEEMPEDELVVVKAYHVDEDVEANNKEIERAKKQQLRETAKVGLEKRFRLKMDGTAKIRGLGHLQSAAAHTFFGDSDEEGKFDASTSKDGSSFKALIEDIVATDSDASDDMAGKAPNQKLNEAEDKRAFKQRYLETLRSRLSKVQPEDQARAKEKLRDKKKARKLRAKQLVSVKREAAQLELMGDEEDDADGSFDGEKASFSRDFPFSDEEKEGPIVKPLKKKQRKLTAKASLHDEKEEDISKLEDMALQALAS